MMRKILFLCIAFALHSGEARPGKFVRTFIIENSCSYKSCPATLPNALNVHLVPHTHDDVGWLKTVDQYYFGSKPLVQKAGVQYILDSVVQSLLQNPERRFIYVESAFFFKWWREQTPELHTQVKSLVNQGRLEFISGGWSMNDEATTHYQSTIDQFSLGLRRLNETFGECGRPRVGWQIDPFGHSREMASILAQMNFDGLFFGRLDYQDKDDRLMSKTAEMIWRASANLGDSSNLFTGALYNQYQPPPGFCFDILCADEPINDAKHSPDNNVEARLNEFYDFVKRQSHYYRTNNVIVTMGGDFTYQDANVHFKNMDKLIKYSNERQANNTDINLIYSTPSCYLKALRDAGITWPTKDDDFFPYASDPHAYWTGYFTSRPTLKRFERMGNHFLQVCKQLTALSPKSAPEFLPHLNFMREAMGIMQHHDAITGTEKQQVAFDYALRLDVGMRACSTNTRTVLNHLTTGKQPAPNKLAPAHKDFMRDSQFEFDSCRLLNISICNITETSKKFIVTLYNPLAHIREEYVRIPVPTADYKVCDHEGSQMETQIVPIPESVLSLNSRKSPAKFELIFFATDLPPFGYKSYFVTKGSKGHYGPVPDAPNTSSLTSIGNEYLSLIFDTNGFLAAVTTGELTRTVNQEFMYYEAALGNNKEMRNRSSGAYIFRPQEDGVRSLTMSPTITIYRGELVEEVHQVYTSWISQVVRVYRGQRQAEFEWLIGPIPIEDGVGKEIITRFNTDIQSSGVFYTDSNGREMIKRMRDHRDTWKVKLEEHVAGNYYPVTTKIALEDATARLAILTDRAQGGSSLGDGSLELMLHRRLLHDDAFGVDESLNETAYGEGLVARGIHTMILSSMQADESPSLKAVERFVQLEQLLPTWKFFSNASEMSIDDWQEKFTNIFRGLAEELPRNVHLLTFEPWNDHEILIRFEHILEKDDDPTYSKPARLEIRNLLRGYSIKNIREMTLDGNQILGDVHRMEFVPDSENYEYEMYGTFFKSTESVHLQRADKPLLATKFNDEPLPSAGLGAESNRLKREQKREMQLNRLRAEKLRDINIELPPLPQDRTGTKFIVELNPMQIRTFTISLEPHSF